jgi:hypothetical protein
MGIIEFTNPFSNQRKGIENYLGRRGMDRWRSCPLLQRWGGSKNLDRNLWGFLPVNTAQLVQPQTIRPTVHHISSTKMFLVKIKTKMTMPHQGKAKSAGIGPRLGRAPSI